ncbi:putative quinol monooxygenase [Microbacterium sp. SORGH_AS_0888]|uniref:putative quinol monooxygenase n=1 Tax=Microbacterium sp. SORGH_AS_0888 TaxID=3041791 RepID=UPI0027895DDD|nr:putative quinol monooxygenase [Microbacterium sp. SORGH_AS_0888]MDQ1130566.1 quinol monooxygenase YgiN [Microbacterium sp. SORGH_AS_0888]
MTRRALYAQFEAVPGAGDAVAELVRGYAADVTAEPGNLRFDAHRLEEDSDRFFVYEEYASEQAFRAHVGADYCAAFNSAISSLVVGGGSRLTWLSPVT